MAFSIRNNRLLRDNRIVEFSRSPYVGETLPRPTKILVMHFTYGASARSSAEWFRDPENQPGSSAHVIVERDGSVIQCVPFDTVAWHAGRSRWGSLVGLNRYALSIELANWGYLKKQSDGWSSYTGVRISEPFIAAHRNGNPDGSRTPIGWEPYPEAQIATAVAIAREFVNAYGINEIVGHDDIAPTRKWDPGPAFDMMRFRALIFGTRDRNEDIRLRVAVTEGLNLRSGPGTEFPSTQLLPIGTLVEPIEASGVWLSASVIGANGQPNATGWLHSRYLEHV